MEKKKTYIEANKILSLARFREKNFEYHFLGYGVVCLCGLCFHITFWE